MIVCCFAVTGCGALLLYMTASEDVVTPEERTPRAPRTEATASESELSRHLTSSRMRSFEEEHAVSAEQERYLAFGAFVMTNNQESIRVFELDWSSFSAGRILSNFWSIEDRESAITQLEFLANADGQSPRADEIFNTFVKQGYTHPLSGADFRVHESALEYATQSQVNDGLRAYEGAKALLTESFGFTEEELLDIPTLVAWDYGRVAIIARYGVQAGFLEEDEVWDYLKRAADSAAENYDSWREYTAAHILGRALAFGNPSDDFEDVLDFLLNHPESSFQTIDFHIE